MFLACRQLARIPHTIINVRTLASIRFSKSHEYIKLDGDVGTVGITDHAANALGDVVFVELPALGTKYAAGETFGSVESVKAASDVYVPVSGEIIAVNDELTTSPGKVNESPLEGGWFIKIKVNPEGQATFGELMNEDSYKKHVDEGAH